MKILPPPMPEYLTMPGSSLDLLGDELIAIITDAINGHERSQQVELGPSEIGHPCARRIGYQLLGFPEHDRGPAWKPQVGTAVHEWLEKVFDAHNLVHYQPDGVRFITEATLFAGTINGRPLTGHCDVYDQVTFTVIDWKCVGPKQLKKYAANGPGEQYISQAHTYGRAWQLSGRRVDHVAVMFLPRDGELRDRVWWHEPYDEQVALRALERVEGIDSAVTALSNAALDVLPTADAYCFLCPFHRSGSTDLTKGCPGAPGTNPRGVPAPHIDPSNPFG